MEAAPPGGFISAAVDLAVVPTTKRDGKLIAHLAAERRVLREAQVMSVTGDSPADEASLLRHIFQVLAIA